MQELERLINIYHMAFIVFLILAILFFIISVILFFRFNIRGIFDMRTGRGARKTIQKMEELNAQTGKLRQDVVYNTPVSLSPEDRIAFPPTERRLDALANVQNAVSDEQPAYEQVYEDSQKTELLSEQGAGETTLLQQNNDNYNLSQEKAEDVPQPEKDVKIPGVFKIEKNLMWIHTEEVL